MSGLMLNIKMYIKAKLDTGGSMDKKTMKDAFIFFGRETDIEVIKPFFSEFDITSDISKATKGVVVGGDGSILSDSIKYPIMQNQLPVIKVHFRSDSYKSLGYTIDVNVKNIKMAISDLERGLYLINKNRLLELDLDGTTYYALNDVAISAKLNRSILMKTYLESIKYKDCTLIPTPKCTGIMVSSAYGSTAWNLAVDGAITLEDNMNLMLLTFRESPLKPDHFVLSDRVSLKLESKVPIVAIIDGKFYEIDDYEQGIAIKLSKKFIPIIRTKNTYETITSKLRRLTSFQFEQVK
jgi:NAD kinase